MLVVPDAQINRAPVIEQAEYIAADRHEVAGEGQLLAVNHAQILANIFAYETYGYLMNSTREDP